MRIFLIEDNPVDALRLKRDLAGLADEFSISEVQSLAEAKETLAVTNLRGDSFGFGATGQQRSGHSVGNPKSGFGHSDHCVDRI